VREPAAASHPVGREKILVVEDDRAMSRLTCRLLAAMGYESTEATTGAEALDILARDAEIALVLTDVVLPGGMKGPQLVAAAAAQRPGLKFLYMSGYTDNAIAQRGSIPEGIKLLQKPFRRNELSEAIRATLDSPSVAKPALSTSLPRS
jgi:DNA-binding NtrC family response regulator